jgi:hypothetical protein
MDEFHGVEDERRRKQRQRRNKCKEEKEKFNKKWVHSNLTKKGFSLNI